MNDTDAVQLLVYLDGPNEPPAALIERSAAGSRVLASLVPEELEAEILTIGEADGLLPRNGFLTPSEAAASGRPVLRLGDMRPAPGAVEKPPRPIRREPVGPAWAGHEGEAAVLLAVRQIACVDVLGFAPHITEPDQQVELARRHVGKMCRGFVDDVYPVAQAPEMFTLPASVLVPDAATLAQIPASRRRTRPRSTLPTGAPVRRRRRPEP